MTDGVVAQGTGLHLAQQYGESISDKICARHYCCSVRGHTPNVGRTVIYTMGLRVRIPLEAFLCAALLNSTEADP